VPGGGIAPDGRRWVSSRPAFLLPVRVLGKLFRRLFLTRLIALHERRPARLLRSMVHLAERRAFLRHLAAVRKKRWVVYAKAPFAGPEAVLAYLSRYTHRVAISNSRLIVSTGIAGSWRDPTPSWSLEMSAFWQPQNWTLRPGWGAKLPSAIQLHARRRGSAALALG
jgi:hypothetical protein